MPNQSRSSASAAARRSARQNQLDQLNNLGAARSNFVPADMFTNLELVVGDFITRVKSNIQNENGMVVTGEIENITADVSAAGIQVNIPNYLIFQDKGVNGSKIKGYNTDFTYRDKRPPVSVFKEWIKTKNIQLRNEASYDRNGVPHTANLTTDQLINKAANAMATSVFQKGFKPRNVYSKEIPNLITDIQANVQNYITNFLTQQMTNNNGTTSPVP